MLIQSYKLKYNVNNHFLSSFIDIFKKYIEQNLQNSNIKS